MPRIEGHIAIVDDVHPILMEMLDHAGLPYMHRPDCNVSEIPALLDGAIGMVIRSKTFVDLDFLEDHRPLFIARAGSGMDNLNEDELTTAGIHLINAPEGNRDSVAEHTIGMLLNLAANITKGSNEVKGGVWDREGNRGFELGGKTIGIVGYGNCGSAVAEKLAGFGMKVIAYDKYKSGFGSEIVQEAEMDQLFRESDIVTYHIPLTEETLGLLNKNYLNRFDKDIVLLNLSRGKIMVMQDLVELLNSGKIKSIGLDVLENEKLGSFTDVEKNWFEALTRNENVIITPHVGGWTHESYRKISEILAQKITRFITKLKKNEKEADEIAGKV